ncbi:hypothetical protein JT06_02590 [Desulfobulbus sp. Tol-SR]|nr:hypothetical protein JT06_02590 [Desulfobulbus sp. Tol-SR]
MTGPPVYIAAAGIISPLGRGMPATAQALRANTTAIAPLEAFPLLQGEPLPVGQVRDLGADPVLPRTHLLAREAARMAMREAKEPPEAIILGCTTGGILTTERLLRDKVADPQTYRYHGLASVAEDIAGLTGCRGPALTIATACSSSAVAITLAIAMLRRGGLKRILVGGVDSLSRLTYFGFHSLQLVDRQGCRPLDATRQGMSVAEGAAMLLLTTLRPDRPLGVVLGAGLSCDAYHPTAPHPQGRGAVKVMQAALADAGLPAAAIDYINLHGTGTPDNDLAEARAVTALFPQPPPLSSIKGATGHSLAAAGAIEAVAAILTLRHGFVPGTVGCRQPDPALGLMPQLTPIDRPVRTVLSNSFGFGGNNGSVVIGREDAGVAAAGPTVTAPLAVHGCACLTGAGPTRETMALLAEGRPVAGMMTAEAIAGHLPPRLVRRAKRLTRLALALAVAAHADNGGQDNPAAVFMGTGWGALTETCDFLDRLETSAEQFPSPTDFISSVHNGAAGQVAIHFGATAANVTASGGDYSFEQALLAADSLLEASGQSALLLGVDEGHDPLSPLLDPSVAAGNSLADGGGALFVNRDPVQAHALIRLAFYQQDEGDATVDQLVQALAGPDHDCAAVLVGIPAAETARGRRQLACFIDRCDRQLPVCEYRPLLGQFASASAVATALATICLGRGILPGAVVGGSDIPLGPGSRIVVLGTGRFLTAIECIRP